jgi:hypothetical protein
MGVRESRIDYASRAVGSGSTVSPSLAVSFVVWMLDGEATNLKAIGGG